MGNAHGASVLQDSGVSQGVVKDGLLDGGKDEADVGCISGLSQAASDVSLE